RIVTKLYLHPYHAVLIPTGRECPGVGRREDAELVRIIERFAFVLGVLELERDIGDAVQRVDEREPPGGETTIEEPGAAVPALPDIGADFYVVSGADGELEARPRPEDDHAFAIAGTDRIAAQRAEALLQSPGEPLGHDPDVHGPVDRADELIVGAALAIASVLDVRRRSTVETRAALSCRET